MIVRPAELYDAEAMTDLQNAVIRNGGTTAFEVERTADEVAQDYLIASTALCARIAEADGRIAGFQTMGHYAEMPERWGVIGTFVHPDLQRGGVGAALFSATRDWARINDVPTILAVIRADNVVGLGYHAGRGFFGCGTERDITLKDGRVVGRIAKRFNVAP